MGASSIIILVISSLMLILLAYWLFRAPKEPKTIVEVNNRQSVRIDPSSDGSVHVKIIEYDTWEDKPGDDELYPDLVNTSVNPETVVGDRYFWDMVLDFDKLPADEKERVSIELERRGFIRKEDVAEFALSEKEDVKNEPENPDPANEEPVPIDADPSDGDENEPEHSGEAGDELGNPDKFE